MDTVAYDPKEFASESYAARYTQAFDEYASLRANGVNSELAVLEAFGILRYGFDTSNVPTLALACECNGYVRRKMAEILKTADIKKDLWPIQQAVSQLLSLAKDSRVRDATRLNAIVQLNVLCGYTDLDNATKRRAQQGIADFMKLQSEWDSKQGAEVEAAEEVAAGVVKH
jgi:hypothetical protein